MNNKKDKKILRPPVVVVMGHIDHGKSTLLDYIRKSNVVDKEAGGITQHISAYEVVHKRDGKDFNITFLDTPGHEAFKSIRSRGASVADIAVLVVSAEDGVKPQTVEALNVIKEAQMPYVVAINKIDKPGANVEKTKQNLAENDVFLEGFGGSVSWGAISAKTGEGVNELLDLLLLVAELEELTGERDAEASGIIIESNMDTKKGISVTAIIKNGTLKKGQFAVSGTSIAPLRIFENFLGKPISEATFSSPVRIIGWDSAPKVGAEFQGVNTKNEALEIVAKNAEAQTTSEQSAGDSESEKTVIPIVIKADSAGSLDALVYEIGKLGNDRVIPKIVLSGIGPLSENDVKSAMTKENSLLISFHTKTDSKAESLAQRLGKEIHSFDIIYKLTEWLAQAVLERTPSIEVEEAVGVAKILKTFSQSKDKQVVGGRVESGIISVGDQVRILRRDAEIVRGRVRELQQTKQKTSSVSEGEFGAMIEAKFEIAMGDKIEALTLVKR
ncbi:MAG: translation initiation factor IF-2 [Candidatus Zambryskibacteria bacterium RIFCSPHIGHO2_12_FULL_43_12b]|uniref:Translation initiation factor IF-2 n=1 Tax=Candidatus Zambryskibacteria bacterium RIFCSPLOWO2_01_FULL_43_17 TaxID=1802760 RepID=A0A1G2U460_9BACT|nr:MAG: translation initiation factor IF-2 [Candidatus Zambryskibacteria bacterium RIFCSPHIGHO2_12_FULL_43_12b]OHB04297.1 MAG: translation initiation factor IF-2 [Candidatus Zambryskibacteria bacterium RIFCSPLOWO2_01_FULL_43_17]